MIIETYRTLKEKGEHFDNTVIDSKQDFDNLLLEWTDQKNHPSKDFNNTYFFRGLPEAKFKLYSSAQRFWISEELYKQGRTYEEFIQSQIENAKAFQANLLIKFYNAFGHHAYDLSILSFLQHYGAPTPLIDFTYRFDCALFFATEGLIHNPSTDIDNYFSIYMIESNPISGEFQSIISHIDFFLSQIDDILENYKDIKIDVKILEDFEQMKYKTFHRLKLFYLPGYIPEGILFKLKNKPDFELVYNQHNLNIINQSGLFVFNSDSTNPLEYHFTGRLEETKTFYLPKIKCWNIHKSLNEYAIKHLTIGSHTPRHTPIDRKLLFPQEEYIATNASKEFKNFK